MGGSGDCPVTVVAFAATAAERGGGGFQRPHKNLLFREYHGWRSLIGILNIPYGAVVWP